MPPAEGIRKLGFHRWHERQLIESHVYLVTGFLSLIMVLACFEGFSFRAPGLKPFLLLAVMLGGAVLCVVSLRLYLSKLARAMELGEQAACGRCGSNGRLQVMGSTFAPAKPGEDEEADACAGSIDVECRKCGYRWTMGVRKAF